MRNKNQYYKDDLSLKVAESSNMDISIHSFVEFDDFLIATEPLYDIRRTELLEKINYLKQKLFWSKIIPLECLIKRHKLIYEWAVKMSSTVLGKMTWEEEFEKTLNKHDLSFEPGKIHENYEEHNICCFDTHLCSGEKGDWVGAGFGLKFFASQRERQKYINLTADIDSYFAGFMCCKRYDTHETNPNTFHFEMVGCTKINPLDMINILKYGFTERFDIDKLIFCCEHSFNKTLGKLRLDAEVLEKCQN